MEIIKKKKKKKKDSFGCNLQTWAQTCLCKSEHVTESAGISHVIQGQKVQFLRDRSRTGISSGTRQLCSLLCKAQCSICARFILLSLNCQMPVFVSVKEPMSVGGSQFSEEGMMSRQPNRCKPQHVYISLFGK